MLDDCLLSKGKKREIWRLDTPSPAPGENVMDVEKSSLLNGGMYTSRRGEQSDGFPDRCVNLCK